MIFLIILDGSDEGNVLFPNSESASKAAHTPCLDHIIRNGVSGKAEFFIPKRDADSLTCITTMLGVLPDEIPVSRAPLEVLGAGIDVEKNALIWRCNVVATKNGRLHSFNGGGLSKAEMHDFVIAAASRASPNINLFHLSDYRSILVMRPDCRYADHQNYGFHYNVPPPHQNLGLPVSDLLKGVSSNQELTGFIQESSRIKQGYLLYPWGAGKKAELPQYSQMKGRTACCVCKAEIMSGIAKAMGMRVKIPGRATGDFDTDLKGKAHAALEFAGQCDTVVIHINGTDELAHRKDFDGKMKFLEKIDSELIGELLSQINMDARFLVTSDHVTSSQTGRHEKSPVKWHCADFKVAGRCFSPPQLEGDLSDGRLFYKLLQEGRN